MLDEVEINKLMSELNSYKSEIKNLKSRLGTLDRKKEELFREKRKVSSDIFSRIKEAQGYKEKRNSLTNVVKSTKESKEELQQRHDTLEADINKLKEEKKKILEKLGVDDPGKIKRDIKHLEFKIETEAMSFEKEKELMKQVSKLKKQYENSKGVGELNNQLDVKYRDLREVKSQMNMSRKIVQHSAKESQKHHVELIESSKEIDELKKREETFDAEIEKIKAEMSTLNSQISEINAKVDPVKQKLSENNVKLKEDLDKTTSEILKQKDEEVKEKLKTGKKLTTEDLLILQRSMKKDKE